MLALCSGPGMVLTIGRAGHNLHIATIGSPTLMRMREKCPSRL